MFAILKKFFVLNENHGNEKEETAMKKTFCIIAIIMAAAFAVTFSPSVSWAQATELDEDVDEEAQDLEEEEEVAPADADDEAIPADEGEAAADADEDDAVATPKGYSVLPKDGEDFLRFLVAEEKKEYFGKVEENMKAVDDKMSEDALTAAVTFQTAGINIFAGQLPTNDELKRVKEAIAKAMKAYGFTAPADPTDALNPMKWTITADKKAKILSMAAKAFAVAKKRGKKPSAAAEAFAAKAKDATAKDAEVLLYAAAAFYRLDSEVVAFFVPPKEMGGKKFVAKPRCSDVDGHVLGVPTEKGIKEGVGECEEGKPEFTLRGEGGSTIGSYPIPGNGVYQGITAPKGGGLYADVAIEPQFIYGHGVACPDGVDGCKAVGGQIVLKWYPDVLKKVVDFRAGFGGIETYGHTNYGVTRNDKRDLFLGSVGVGLGLDIYSWLRPEIFGNMLYTGAGLGGEGGLALKFTPWKYISLTAGVGATYYNTGIVPDSRPGMNAPTLNFLALNFPFGIQFNIPLK